MQTKKLALLIYIPPLFLLTLGLIIWFAFSSPLSKELQVSREIKRSVASQLKLEERLQLNKISTFQNTSLIAFKSEICKFPFLKRELRKLNELEKKSILPIPRKLLERKKWIASGINAPSLEESWEGKRNGVSESLERLMKPLQLETEDLLNLLSFIEGKVKINQVKPPHLIISEMNLKRLNIVDGWDTFQIDKLEMIKRDYSCFYTDSN